MESEIRGPHSPPSVLVVVDQPVLAEVVRLALGHAQLQARVVPSVGEAEAVLSTAPPPHLAVVDADVGAGAILDRVSAATAGLETLPVLALTRRGDLETKLAAFARGVDDIVTVPFSPEELVARAFAIMRRSYGAAAAFTPVIRLGELEIDIMRRSVTSGGHELRLTSLEQSLLYLLAANAGRLLTRDEILDHLWGIDYAAESNVVDRHVRNLRAKLQNDWHRPRYIATVPGKGYRFLPTDLGEDERLDT
jgi:DNA-binding response OmpR family regulator